ncbi:MAG: hypothetical protein MUD12_12320 [Spirochaetes bacterium]|jgi:hypothetical protein|nr:hypothetical protein [Spirochaetota bacterium]
MSIKCRFRSIRVRKIEVPVENSARTLIKMKFDPDTVQKHDLELGIREIISERAWVINFFFAAMIISALHALVYGLMVVGFKADFSGGACRHAFIGSAVVTFLGLWSAFSIAGAVKNRKKEFVAKIRGDGNWKIIDEKKWDRFYRILTAPRDRKKAE